MPPPVFLTISEQVAGHLREELFRRRWTGTIPGLHKLAEELGVNSKTVEAALNVLENEGLLVRQGAGRRRRIVLPRAKKRARSMRVALLISDDQDKQVGYMVELHHMLLEVGHDAFYPEKTLGELGMNVKRIANLVDKTGADAWIVGAASREVLEWFSQRREPTFAMFGSYEGLPLAGMKPDKLPSLAVASRHLVELGHRRIVMLTRRRRRLPAPGIFERRFLDELEACGIRTGDYNLPDWEETSADLHRIMDSLFRHTPPTALLLDEAPFFTAALRFLAGRGIRVPDDVSLLCADPDPNFAWCDPPVSHIYWDSAKVVRRIVRWAANVSNGKLDTRQTLTRAEFVAGGTIGPAPEGQSPDP